MTETNKELQPSYVELANELDFDVYKTNDDGFTQYRMATCKGSPLVILTNIETEKSFRHVMWGYVRTTSWDFDGDRSDLNDFMSSVLAITLKGSGYSVSMPTLEHPVADEPAGVYARLLTFERQNLVCLEPNISNFEEVQKVLVSAMMADFFERGYFIRIR